MIPNLNKKDRSEVDRIAGTLITGIILFFVIFLLSQPRAYAQQHKDGNQVLLNKGWLIYPSEKITVNDLQVSSSQFSITGWYAASVPSTVMGTLVNDKVYKDVFTGDNLKNIPVQQFEKPWWYRTEFTLSKNNTGKTVKLCFNGIIYSADIWLNGVLIAKADSVKGVYRRFEFNISNIIKAGKNILAVKIFPPEPGDPSVGFVDWNPSVPDRSMGIWRDVRLKFNGGVEISSPFVQSKIDLSTLKSAELTVSAELQNNTGKTISGTLLGEIGNIKFSKNITLASGQNNQVIFLPGDFPQLKIKNPRIWWTYNLGKPELYKLKLKFTASGKTPDVCETNFGIREVSDYINDEGFRGYKLNGKKILILGGGWVDNLFLNQEYNNLKYQVAYIKQMGLNTIRLEGIWGENSDLFNLCDENGILIMAGWSCQWEWKDYLGKETDDFGGIKSPEDINLIAQSFQDQVKWLRNHPAIIMWLYGSDLIPRPELESRYQEILKQYDPSRPFIASAGEHTSALTGKTAVKMRGPYDYEPPVYWWADKSNGGAFGFNTEVGPGAEVPPVESVKKMIPENHLWPIDSIWNFHCGKNAFGNLNNYNNAISGRLGAPENLNDYCTKAQLINYENTRAMFEANVANKYKATGVIHWMLNAAWPKLWWQLYDYYLMPGGAFFGTKKACQPVHIMYNYGSNTVIAANNTVNNTGNLIAKVRILNFDLSEKYSHIVNIGNLKPDSIDNILQLPEIKDLSAAYFLDLKLLKNEKIISTNFYCLSAKHDELDTAKSNWYITPVKEYADMTELNKLKKISLSVNSKFSQNGDKELVEAELSNNTGELAFQVVLDVKNSENGNSILPIFWDDNYFSLLPGEKRIINGYFYKKSSEEKSPLLKVTGWNIK